MVAYHKTNKCRFMSFYSGKSGSLLSCRNPVLLFTYLGVDSGGDKRHKDHLEGDKDEVGGGDEEQELVRLLHVDNVKEQKAHEDHRHQVVVRDVLPDGQEQENLTLKECLHISLSVEDREIC